MQIIKGKLTGAKSRHSNIGATDLIGKEITVVLEEKNDGVFAQQVSDEIYNDADLVIRINPDYHRTINLKQTITIEELIECAKLLKAEDGEEGGEYDRALLELVTDAAHIRQSDRIPIAKLIGVDARMGPAWRPITT